MQSVSLIDMIIMIASFLAMSASVLGAKLYVVDNLNEQPSISPFYLVDTDAKTATKVSSKINGAHVEIAGAAVCNGVYYAVWTDVPDFGLMSVDLSSGATTYHDTDGLFHAIWCGAGDNSKGLLAIQSSPAPPFSVVTYDLTSNASTTIATFPQNDTSGGTDTVFSYNQGADEVWMVGVNEKQFGDHNQLAVVGVSTGKVTTFPFARIKLYSYGVFPEGAPAGDGVSFAGIMSKENSMSGELEFTKHTISKGVVQTSRGAKAPEYTGGSPYVKCGAFYWASPDGDKMLSSFDPKTQKEGPTMDLSTFQGAIPGGLACASSE